MKRINVVVLIVLLVFPVLSACTPAIEAIAPTATVAPTATATQAPTTVPTDTPEPEPTATTIPPTEMPVYREKVDVGGYNIYLKCVGEGDLTIVLIGCYHKDNLLWSPVMKLNPSDSGVKVCVYDQAARGYSDLPLETPRTVEDMTTELHTLLSNANIPGPYVLAGYNTGAHVARYYTHLYPDEVVGMVMINLAHPYMMATAVDIVPTPTDDEDPGLSRLRDYLYAFASDEPFCTAQILHKTSADIVSEVDTLGDIPLVVLWHGVQDRQALIEFWLSYWNVEEELVIDIENAWTEQAKELTALSSNSTFVVAEGTTYDLVNSSPESIVDAIQAVLEDVRNQ